jgi:hypothetical protein
MTDTNLMHMVSHVATKTELNFKDIQKSLDSLTKMVLDNHLALDFLLAEHGRM